MSSKKITYTTDFKLKVLDYYFKHGGDDKFGLKTKTAGHFNVDKKTISRMLNNPEMVKRARKLIAARKGTPTSSSSAKPSPSSSRQPVKPSASSSQSSVSSKASTSSSSSSTKNSASGNRHQVNSAASNINKTPTKPKPSAQSVKDSPGIEVFELPEDPDYSLLKRSINAASNGVASLAKLLVTATEEVRNVILNECDVILECKVCRNLFRSIVNFLAHKRIYCQDEFADVRTLFHKGDVHGITTQSNTVIVEPEPPPDHEPNPMRTAIPTTTTSLRASAQGRLKQSGIDNIALKLARKRKAHTATSSPSETGSSSYFDSLQEVSGTREKLSRDCSVVLEDINNCPTAVYQTFMTPNSTPPGTSMCSRINERENSKVGVTVAIGQNGEIVKTALGNVDTMEVDENTSPISTTTNELTCLTCNTRFATQKTLSVHQRSHHGLERSVYTCPICQSSFLSMWACVKHLQRTHKKSKTQIERLRKVVKRNVQKKIFDPKEEKNCSTDSEKVIDEDDNEEEEEEEEEEEQEEEVEDEEEEKQNQQAKTSTVSSSKAKEITPKKNETRSVSQASPAKMSSHKDDKTSNATESPDHRCIKCDRKFSTPCALVSHEKFCSLMQMPPPRSSMNALKRSETPEKKITIQIRKDYEKPVNSKEGQQLMFKIPQTAQEKENQTKIEEMMREFCELSSLSCIPCGKKYMSVSNLKRHAACHIDWTRYECNLCQFRNYHRYEVISHCIAKHNVQEAVAGSMTVELEYVGQLKYFLESEEESTPSSSDVETDKSNDVPSTSTKNILSHFLEQDNKNNMLEEADIKCPKETEKCSSAESDHDKLTDRKEISNLIDESSNRVDDNKCSMVQNTSKSKKLGASSDQIITTHADVCKTGPQNLGNLSNTESKASVQNVSLMEISHCEREAESDELIVSECSTNTEAKKDNFPCTSSKTAIHDSHTKFSSSIKAPKVMLQLVKNQSEDNSIRKEEKSILLKTKETDKPILFNEDENQLKSNLIHEKEVHHPHTEDKTKSPCKTMREKLHGSPLSAEKLQKSLQLGKEPKEQKCQQDQEQKQQMPEEKKEKPQRREQEKETLEGQKKKLELNQDKKKQHEHERNKHKDKEMKPQMEQEKPPKRNDEEKQQKEQVEKLQKDTMMKEPAKHLPHIEQEMGLERDEEEKRQTERLQNIEEKPTKEQGKRLKRDEGAMLQREKAEQLQKDVEENLQQRYLVEKLEDEQKETRDKEEKREKEEKLLQKEDKLKEQDKLPQKDKEEKTQKNPDKLPLEDTDKEPHKDQDICLQRGEEKLEKELDRRSQRNKERRQREQNIQSQKDREKLQILHQKRLPKCKDDKLQIEQEKPLQKDREEKPQKQHVKKHHEEKQLLKDKEKLLTEQEKRQQKEQENKQQQMGEHMKKQQQKDHETQQKEHEKQQQQKEHEKQQQQEEHEKKQPQNKHEKKQQQQKEHEKQQIEHEKQQQQKEHEKQQQQRKEKDQQLLDKDEQSCPQQETILKKLQNPYLLQQKMQQTSCIYQENINRPEKKVSEDTENTFFDNATITDSSKRSHLTEAVSEETLEVDSSQPISSRLGIGDDGGSSDDFEESENSSLFVEFSEQDSVTACSDTTGTSQYSQDESENDDTLPTGSPSDVLIGRFSGFIKRELRVSIETLDIHKEIMENPHGSELDDDLYEDNKPDFATLAQSIPKDDLSLQLKDFVGFPKIKDENFDRSQIMRRSIEQQTIVLDSDDSLDSSESEKTIERPSSTRQSSSLISERGIKRPREEDFDQESCNGEGVPREDDTVSIAMNDVEMIGSGICQGPSADRNIRLMRRRVSSNSQSLPLPMDKISTSSKTSISTNFDEVSDDTGTTSSRRESLATTRFSSRLKRSDSPVQKKEKGHEMLQSFANGQGQSNSTVTTNKVEL